MTRTVKFQGNPLTLIGRTLVPGSPAPDFNVVSQDMKTVTLSDFEGKIKVISSFPSLDTPVCDLQVKEFNKRLAAFSPEVVVIGISKDLPFAQKRFCGENEIKNEHVLSDYRSSSFGINYGVLIKELNLLARSVRIIDKSGIIRYIQNAPEITEHLDYDDVIKTLGAGLKNTVSADKNKSVLPSKCTPCEGGIAPLPKETVEKLMAQHRGWEVVETKKIIKEFKFKDFQESKYFLDTISVIAEEQGHHPTMTLSYNKVRVTLTTHAASGLTDNDFIMARIIDDVAGGWL